MSDAQAGVSTGEVDDDERRSEAAFGRDVEQGFVDVEAARAAAGAGSKNDSIVGPMERGQSCVADGGGGNWSRSSGPAVRCRPDGLIAS
jgi:hypothetical protein